MSATNAHVSVVWLSRERGEITPTCFTGHIVIPARQQMHDFVRTIAEFYASHTDAEIEAINRAAELEWHETAYDNPREASKPRAATTKPGFVYLVQSVTGHYKIGLTKDPANRARTFGVQLPFEVEFICLIPTDNMSLLEEELHQRFAEKRLNGEWFDLSLEDVEYIKGLAK